MKLKEEASVRTEGVSSAVPVSNCCSAGVTGGGEMALAIRAAGVAFVLKMLPPSSSESEEELKPTILASSTSTTGEERALVA